MFDLAGTLGFTGNFEVSLDSKGRATVPAAFIRTLQSGEYAIEGGAMVASISYDRSVTVSPIAVWKKRMAQMEELSDLDENSRRLKTIMRAYSFQLSIDGNNRIRIPAQLMEKCGIEKEATVVGQLDHFQIWDRKAWNEFSQTGIENMNSSAQKALGRE
jgi:MraZ protein